MKRLFTYKVLIPFTSKTLNKTFRFGEVLRAPCLLGNKWIKSKIVQKINTKKNE